MGSDDSSGASIYTKFGLSPPRAKQRRIDDVEVVDSSQEVIYAEYTHAYALKNARLLTRSLFLPKPL